MKRLFKNILVMSISLAAFTACEKDYLVTDPTNSVSGSTIFASTEGGYVALNGIYRSTYVSDGHGMFGQKAVDLTIDLLGEDMIVNKQGYGWFNGEYQQTAITTSTSTSRSGLTWKYYYGVINNANRIIDAIDKAAGAQEDKDNIKGQALALRAHSYFYLVNLFQQNYKGNETKPGVPLYTKPTSEGAGRGTVQQVYDQINADLVEAKTLLKGATRKDASHINATAVSAIQAMVALQQGDYAAAKVASKEAQEGIALGTSAQFKGGSMFNTVNSPEYIWGVSINTEQATIFASLYSHIDISSGGYAALGTQKKITKALYDKIPDTDVRKELFTAIGKGTSSNPTLNQTKLRLRTAGVWAADYVYLRVAEQYLIEAESEARLGNNAAAITVLEKLVKTRNPEYTATGLTGDALVNEILTQRKIELWGEGRGLLDVKRVNKGLVRATGEGNHNGSDLMGGVNFATPAASLNRPAGDPVLIFRIPQDEINANKMMTNADQNP